MGNILSHTSYICKRNTYVTNGSNYVKVNTQDQDQDIYYDGIIKMPKDITEIINRKKNSNTDNTTIIITGDNILVKKTDSLTQNDIKNISEEMKCPISNLNDRKTVKLPKDLICIKPFNHKNTNYSIIESKHNYYIKKSRTIKEKFLKETVSKYSKRKYKS